MTNAVIDNSTLTAVERVLGRVPIGIGYDLSGDLSAFEAYLTALLFYDEPARIDDYKVEHSKERSNFFKELGAVQFLPSYYGCLLKQSRQLTSDMFLKIRGGKLADNVISDFLRDIDLVVCPAWQMQSSDFYLRIRLLSDGENGGIEKYTPLMNAIFNQLSETHRSNDRPNWQKELISSSGHEIKDDYGENCGARKISGDVKAFAAGLNWLALRSVFYAICSEHLQATAITHPIRSDFLAQFYTRKINIDRPDQREAVLSYFRSTAEGIIGSSNEVLGGMALKLRTPLISAWAAVKTGSPSEARSLILDKRFSPEGIALRARMRDIEDLHEQGDVSKSRADAAKLFRDFESAMSGFCRKFGKR